jgi:hypothetical protein
VSSNDYRIVSHNRTVDALRDSGYSSPTSAVAELVDNSIEAGASNVDIMLLEVSGEEGRIHARSSISEIAVLDDGSGMPPDALRRSLKFGDGTKLGSRKGMGRFGVGLPNASVSQARRVDVWSWQNGTANALHTYLSLSEIAEGREEVPEPQHSPPPARLLEASRIGEQRTGTLVVWSELDRLTWKTAKTIRRHAAEHLGRLYRKFIVREESRVSIVLIDCLDGAQRAEPYPVLANDPLFLTVPAVMPKPFDTTPMFEAYGKAQSIDITYVNRDGNEVTDSVTVTCSFAKHVARVEDPTVLPWPQSYPNAGSSPWGKEAAKALGVSLVRADRELLTDTSWTNSHEPTERWWSVEVAYPPTLDEVFGTVTNKQSATEFSKGSSWDDRDEREEGEDYYDYIDRLKAEGDRRVPLFELWQHISKQIRNMREEQSKRRNARGLRRHEGPTEGSKPGVKAAVVGTSIMEQSKREGGEPGVAGNRGSGRTEAERKKEVIGNLTLVHKIPPEIAIRIFDEIVLHDLTVNFVTGNVPGAHFFFDVESLPDLLQVSINESNPAYRHLIEVLEEVPADESREALLARLNRSSLAFRLLLFAWAQMEDRRSIRIDEQDRMRDIRNEWGRLARDCFRQVGDGDGAQ